MPTVYEANFEAELPYYVCTYHPGKTWNTFRKENKKLKAEEAYFVIYSLIDAFEYLHKMNRSHCDAHEDNILIRERVFGEGILIIDFGSGHRGSDPEIVGAPGDFRAQAEQAFLNIKGALGAAGGGFEHVVKLCHYFIDLQAHFHMMRDIRLKYFDPARMPASTMIQVGALTDEKAIYEIDVVAVLPQA